MICSWFKMSPRQARAVRKYNEVINLDKLTENYYTKLNLEKRQ